MAEDDERKVVEMAEGDLARRIRQGQGAEVEDRGNVLMGHLRPDARLLLDAPALLLVPRLRPLAFLLALGMFGMIAVTMQHLVFFALQMLSFFVLFADEAWLARVRGALRRRGG